MGRFSIASGASSTALGYFTGASGEASTAMGRECDAGGVASTALGWFNSSQGHSSVAMGNNTQAYGDYSLSMGAYTSAVGVAATAFGDHTHSAAYGSFALGRYNVGGGNTNAWIDSDPVFEVGIGADESNRDNALTVLKNGNTGIGTTAPTEVLDVDGGMRVRSLPSDDALSNIVVADADGVLHIRDASTLGGASLYGGGSGCCDEQIEMIESQGTLIASLEEKIRDRDEKINDLEARLDILASQMEQILTGKGNTLQRETLNDRPWIQQNMPNPFGQDTEIGYYIPMDSHSAGILVHDMSGRIIKRIAIEQFGHGTLSLKAGTLESGTYTYELIVDGAQIDAKKMVFTR
jgi:hypothetical protein